jgi:hypothetical protein
MRITSTDALAMTLGAVAIVFSGFVLAHSAWGGVALLIGGALALGMSPPRTRVSAVAPVVWIVFVLLLLAGVAGFLVGFGVFDSPALGHDFEATIHHNETTDTSVIVTGTVRNTGDGPAKAVFVDVALQDRDNRTIDTGTVRVGTVRPGTRQQFFLRFGPDRGLSAFEDAGIELSSDR